MNKFNAFLEEKIMPVAGRIAAQRHLQALRDGIILTMPLIIIGSLFLILANLPIPGYPEFMAGIFGDQWAEKLSYPVNVSFDIMALIATFGIAYRLAEKYDIDALSSGAIAVAAFLLATPLPDSVHTRRRNRGNFSVRRHPDFINGKQRSVCRHADRDVLH